MTDIAERLERAGLRVKPLEWWLSDIKDTCSDAPFGRYRIRRDGAWFALYGPRGRIGGALPTLEAARAAAEADHAARAYGMMEVNDE